jgi:hypothetical protein
MQPQLDVQPPQLRPQPEAQPLQLQLQPEARPLELQFVLSQPLLEPQEEPISVPRKVSGDALVRSGVDPATETEEKPGVIESTGITSIEAGWKVPPAWQGEIHNTAPRYCCTKLYPLFTIVLDAFLFTCKHHAHYIQSSRSSWTSRHEDKIYQTLWTS